MKTSKYFIMITLIIVGFLFGNTQAQEADEIMKKSHMAYYYAGDDGLSDVNMTLISKKGKERVREFVMLRLDTEDGGDQKYYTYFKKPSDVSRLTFMVHKSFDGNDARWIYVPSIDLVKPISADDKNSSFVGSDFSYEDVSGRHWTEDNHKLISEGEFGEKTVFIIESIPKKSYKGFIKKITYIDKETYLPLKEEYFNKKEEVERVMLLDKIEVIEGFPTATIRSMENMKKGSKTIVAFNKIDYNVNLTDDLFTERYLKNPPRKFIK